MVIAPGIRLINYTQKYDMGKSSLQSRLDRILTEVAALEPKSRSWISPDDLWDENWKDSVAFIYDPDGVLYHIKSGTHSDLFEIEPNLNDFEYRQDAASRGMLLGRVGYDPYRRAIISFWNESSSDYARLSECLQALEDDGVLDGFETPITISTPIGSYNYTGHAGDTRDLGRTELSPEKRKEHQELLKKVHTLHGDEKKTAMKKLGLGFKSPGKHPWQKAQEKAGMLGPGQKWWAPQSESRQ